MQRGSKKGVAKPVKWDERLIMMAYQFALLGATDKEMASAFDVGIDTISQWKRKHPQFREGYAKGKVDADAKVAYSLYQNAMGYDYYEQQIVRMSGGYKLVEVRKHHAAESWAAAKWLELRRSAEWSVTQKYEIKNTNTNVNVDFAKLSTEHLSALAALSQMTNLKKLS